MCPTLFMRREPGRRSLAKFQVDSWPRCGASRAPTPRRLAELPQPTAEAATVAAGPRNGAPPARCSPTAAPDRGRTCHQEDVAVPPVHRRCPSLDWDGPLLLLAFIVNVHPSFATTVGIRMVRWQRRKRGRKTIPCNSGICGGTSSLFCCPCVPARLSMFGACHWSRLREILIGSK